MYKKLIKVSNKSNRLQNALHAKIASSKSINQYGQLYLVYENTLYLFFTPASVRPVDFEMIAICFVEVAVILAISTTRLFPQL